MNPWEQVDINIYEKHMKSNNVMQLQKLNDIMGNQLKYNKPFVGILGVAGGNGLNHIDTLITKKVYGIDINKEYLEICKSRYCELRDILETIHSDLSDDTIALPFTNLLICNLVIEYIGVKQFCKIIERNSDYIEVISCVIQKNNGDYFVSHTDEGKDLHKLEAVHHDIKEFALTKELIDLNFQCILREKYALPNSKEFIRLDYIKST
ncbi:class I SAM-dependent methyltransferase [Vallitalea okinawensis]|uniref:class I SAM-dependent methyltransferase n=1 Tax=Vallitalea okinawensis TaxID=2078660 RepID=UPI000CFE12CE|nr:class I SAM-dependent methyltransferase [Vallitalea okinawensis]